MEDLALSIVKNHLHMHFVENQWLKCFSLHLCSIVVSPPRKKIHNRFCLSWRKKLNNYMSYHVWQNVSLQQVLIFGCQKKLMTFLHLWSIFWGLIGNQNISQLDYLRPWTFLVKPWLRILLSCYEYIIWERKLLLV